MKNRKLNRKVGKVFGVGVNDADYHVTRLQDSGEIWYCPFFLRWKRMLLRCYHPRFLKENPTYVGCSVHPDWHSFMSFRSWMIEQDWEGKHLDKDLLVIGNKIYSKETCLFVSQEVNKFINTNPKTRGQYPLGVTKDKNTAKFKAIGCREGKPVHIGSYLTVEEAAEAAYLSKRFYALKIASEQKDIRVKEALELRYPLP